MIPTSNYTREKFSDYLEFEVLLETARDLNWTSYSPDYDPTAAQNPTAVLGLTNPTQGDGWIVIDDATTSATHAIGYTGFDIPSGTKITVNGTVRTTSGAVAKGATSITFTGSFTTTVGQKGFFSNPKSLVRVQSTDIDGIIDETLLKLDVTDITSITSIDDIRKLRLYGRRECWAAVMQSVASYYDYGTDEGGSVSRSDVYTSAKQNFELEDERIKLLYSDAQVVNVLSTGATTGRHKVVARW